MEIPDSAHDPRFANGLEKKNRWARGTRIVDCEIAASRGLEQLVKLRMVRERVSTRARKRKRKTRHIYRIGKRLMPVQAGHSGVRVPGT